MKILLLSPLPPPVGGIATWTLNILKYYRSKNIVDLELLHQNTALKAREITKISFLSRVKSGILDGIRIILDFISFLKKEKPDVVHLTSSGSLGLFRDFIILIIAKFFKISVVIHFRFGRISEISNLGNWEWYILKLNCKLSKAIIVLDKNSLETLKKYFNYVTCIPNPISEFAEQLINYNTSSQIDKNKRIIFVGHITRNKGVFELIEAYSNIEGTDELIFVGPYEEAIRDQLLNIASSKASQIRFTGSLNKESVLAEMKKALLLVLPSYTEGFPNVIIEAMAMQCPIIATNVGAIPDMLNHNLPNPAGVVVEPRNVDALVKAMHLVLNDAVQADFFATNALLKVQEEYTLEKVCQQYEKIWHIAAIE